MTILIFHQYFSTNKGAYGTRLYEFARHWVELGHKVKVVTSEYYKSDIKAKNHRKKLVIDGIDVIVLNVLTSNKDNFLKRVYHFLLFSMQSFKYVFTLRYDVVMASSGPITTGIPALCARLIRRKPFVLEVRDLWPGVVEELGIIKSKVVLFGAYLFEAILYRSADQIITLSPGMSANISKRFPVAKVATITNSANTELFKPCYPKPKNTFALYTGNIGQVNNSELLIDAAKELISRGRDDVKIRMIGDGQLYLELLGRVKMENIVNLSILSSIPKRQLVKQYEEAFVSLVPLLNLPLLDTSSPNKLFESIAAGLPVIQTTKGWIKNLLAKHDCGFSIDANDSEALANILIYLYDNPTVCHELGLRSRNLAEKYFGVRLLAKEMLQIIIKLV